MGSGKSCCRKNWISDGLSSAVKPFTVGARVGVAFLQILADRVLFLGMKLLLTAGNPDFGTGTCGFCAFSCRPSAGFAFKNAIYFLKQLSCWEKLL